MENHKSIRDEQELLLLPAYDKTRPVVPVAAIFGANASGKSNLLDALRWLQDAVLHSFASWQPGSGVPRTPFRLDPEAETRPSGFAVDLVLGGERYSYGLVVDDSRVREEWLYTYPHNRRRLIFERAGDDWRFGMGTGKTKMMLLADMTPDNALYLTVAARGDATLVIPVYQWFQSSLRTETLSDKGPDPYEVFEIEDLPDGERTDLARLLRVADLGIDDLRVDWVSPQPTGDEPFAGPTFPELRLLHGPRRVSLPMADESRGTRVWLTLLLPVLRTLRTGGLLCVDEIDSSLHPELSAQLVRLFRIAEANTKHAQLLFTTHDVTLLDEETLARDEIWFVEKKSDSGATRLYPLTDFHPRKNENTEGRYLAGAYGAIPVVSEWGFREAVRRREGDDAAA